jgi:hypothetical protein
MERFEAVGGADESPPLQAATASTATTIHCPHRSMDELKSGTIASFQSITNWGNSSSHRNSKLQKHRSAELSKVHFLKTRLGNADN